MQEQKPATAWFSWPILVLVAAALGNLLWFSAPMRSSRPAETHPAAPPALRTQLAEARLWEDPFEAVSRAQPQRSAAGQKNGAPSCTCAMDTLAREIVQRRAESTLADPGRVIIMPVMVTGSPYAEGNEGRIRTRYAVLAGLSQVGSARHPNARFVPVDREHISFCEIPWPPQAAEANQTAEATTNALPTARSQETSLTIPYEWFERYLPESAAKKESVLVLWLREEAFEEQPLERLRWLIGEGLRKAVAKHGAADTTTNPIPVRIIGPEASTTLRAAPLTRFDPGVLMRSDPFG